MSIRRRTWKTPVTGETREAWIASYTDRAGDRHIKTFTRRKEAEAFLAEASVAMAAGTHTAQSKSVTVAAAAAAWVRSAEIEQRETSTIAQYRQHARHIVDRIGHMKLSDLTAPMLNSDFRDDLLGTMTRAMARKVMSSLKALLREAQRRGNVAQNVALAVKRIDADKRNEDQLKIGIHIPAPDEIRKILAAAEPRTRPLLMVAAFTGLRSSELRGLRWLDVDLKLGELHVRQRADRYGVIGKPKSKAGYRIIPLGPLGLAALREWKLAGPKGRLGLVFPTPDGDNVALHNKVVRPLKAAVRAAGLTDAAGQPK